MTDPTATPPVVLPRIPDTALLGETDLHIKQLAYATDTFIRVSLAVSTVSRQAATVGVNGEVTVTFPGLSTVTGAIVQVSPNIGVYGVVRTVGPVTLYKMRPWFVPVRTAGNTVTGKVVLPPQWWYLGPPTGYGSQYADVGQPVNVSGIAWGTA